MRGMYVTIPAVESVSISTSHYIQHGNAFLITSYMVLKHLAEGSGTSRIGDVSVITGSDLVLNCWYSYIRGVPEQCEHRSYEEVSADVLTQELLMTLVYWSQGLQRKIMQSERRISQG